MRHDENMMSHVCHSEGWSVIYDCLGFSVIGAPVHP